MFNNEMKIAVEDSLNISIVIKSIIITYGIESDDMKKPVSGMVSKQTRRPKM